MLQAVVSARPEGFGEMNDEQLVLLASAGDHAAFEQILTRYKNFVRGKARAYFLAGADREDIVQEGMIGLYKAVRDFRHDRQVSFRAFAEVCVLRQILTAVKTATRQKHQPLNSYISLNRPVYEDESDRVLIEMIGETSATDPEVMVISQEAFRGIETRIGESLSRFELEVLSMYLEGTSYQEIALKLERDPKAVDNALQRIKRKVGKILEEHRRDT